MNVLLLSMPDSFEHMPTVAVRMPNGALCSLAGNIDPHHKVAVADLILVQNKVRETVERLVRENQPDVVGLSVMTFQRKTALRSSNWCARCDPSVRVVVGGYDPSLAPEAYMEAGCGIDYIVRGEGEMTFRELLRAIESGEGFAAIQGLSYHAEDGWHQNLPRPVHTLEGDEIRLPKRDARVLTGYTMLGRGWMWWRPPADAPSIAASVPSSRCAAATFILIHSIAYWPISAMPGTTVRAPSYRG